MATPESQEPQADKTVKLVPIDRIVEDPGIQIRVSIEEADICDHVRTIEEQGRTDIITLYYENDYNTGPLLVSDGHQRLEAYRRKGVTSIPAELIQGSRSDALRNAIRKNGHHGKPLSNADKRRSAELGVVDPVLGEMNDKDLARMIGCSISLVNQCRRGETVDQAATKRQARAESGRTTSVEPSTPSRTAGQAESPAPRSATTRERKEPESRTPTKAAILRQIQQHLTTDVIDEKDLCKLMESATGEYVWVPKAGGMVKLRVVGKTGRQQLKIDTVVKQISFETVVLRNEGLKIEQVTE